MLIMQTHQRIVADEATWYPAAPVVQCKGSRLPPSEVTTAPYGGGMLGRCRVCGGWKPIGVLGDSR